MRTYMKTLGMSLLLALSAGSLQAGWVCAPPKTPPGDGGGPPGKRPPYCTDPCEKCNCSPVYSKAGTYFTGATDLSLPTAAGSGLAVGREYYSANQVDGPLGVGWRSKLTSRLAIATYLFAAPSTYRKVAVISMPDGNQFQYTENGGAFVSPPGRNDTLVQNPDLSWDLSLQRSRATIHFGADGSLQSETDENGNLVTYAYDAQGKLQRMSDGAGSGRYIDVYWGANGRISSLQDSAGRQVQYTYDGQGALTTVTDPVGRATRYSYVQGRFGPMLTRIADNWNRPMTDVTYDNLDRVKTYSENGETYTLTYYYNEYPYPPNTAHTLKVSSMGGREITSYSPDWLVTMRQEDSLAYSPTELISYDGSGRVSQRTDKVGVVTRYTYDTQGRILTTTQDATGPLAVRYDYTYDTAFPDKVASVTPKNPSTNALNPDWQGSRSDYYPAGSASPGSLWHTYRVRSDGTTTDLLGTYEYDAKGRITRQISASGGQTDYVFDPQGNLQSVTGPANNDAGTRPQTTYTYDSSGRITSVTDPQGAATTYTYDTVGRVLTVTLPKPTAGSPLNFVTTYAYDVFDAATGLAFTQVTDPNGKVTRLGYDQFGRLVRSIDALNNATVYAYQVDTLASITDANGNVTSYTYDAKKRLTRTTFPDGAYETYTYRVDGMLATKTDRRNITVTYGYDTQKRLVTKTYSTGGAVTYTYQGQKLTQVQDTTISPNETHTFGYDTAYRVTSNGQASRGTLTYTYGTGDRLATMTVQGGPTTTYAYYPDGSSKTLDWSPVAGQFRYGYTLRGQYGTVTFPNSQTRIYSYDDQGRITQLANALGATNLATYAYGYDLDNQSGQSTMLGQRTSTTATVPSQSFSGALSKYYYDPLYQLTKVDYPSATPFSSEVDSWTYDAIGNRLTSTVNGTATNYSYFKNGANPLNGQRLQSAGATSYTYDAAGNQSTRTGGTTFGYDPENRLTSISGVATYAYDFQGRRASKTVGGVTTTYLYDGVNLVAETAGGVTGYFLNGNGIDEPLATYKAGTLAYVDVDALGSATLTNDAGGNVTLSTIFDAWGASRSETGTRSHPFTYTGRETGESGFHFYRARYYDAAVGRFTTEDPLRERRDQAFVYVANRPTAWTDAFGLYSIDSSCGPNCQGPMRLQDCSERDPMALCLSIPMSEIRSRVGQPGCRRMLQAVGVSLAELDIRLDPNSKFPIFVCGDDSRCVGHGGEGEYFPAERKIPLCRRLFASWLGAAATLFHEILHDINLHDDTPQMTNAVRACFRENFPPGPP